VVTGTSARPPGPGEHRSQDLGSTRADLDDVFALHAAGRTRVIYETGSLSGVNEAIEEVRGGTAKARLVLRP
jgi:D-arabinose 1-dehydrogenase-like Zn-dependent alcohol dehydrogenase